MKQLFLWDDRDFYRSIAAIAVPIALQNLINFGVSMMDTLMLGVLGEVQLSAASIANQMAFMFMVISFGVANGCNVLSAQHWGKGNIGEIKRIISFMFRVVFLIAMLFALLAVAAPGAVMQMFIEDPLVIEEGMVYLRIVGAGFLFSGFTNATIGVLRSMGTVRISVVIYSVSLVINVCLNYILIFGKFGAPALGIAGAATATLVARIVEAAIALVYLFRYEQKIKMRPRDLLTADSRIIRDFVLYASPVLINEILWSSGNAMISVVIGHMGREFVAANSICSVLTQLANAGIFGISNAALTIIGNTIGAGEYDRARRRAKGFLGISLVAGGCAAAIMLLMRVPLIGLYNISDTARGYAFQITAAASFLLVLQTVSMVMMMGVLRGGGDTKFVMVADVIFMWIVAIPLGALAGLVLGAPVPVVYICLKCEDMFKTGVSIHRVIGGKWVKDVTT